MSNTYQNIISHIAEAANKQAQIYLTTPIRIVESQDIDLQRKRVMLKTDESIYEFDEVVVTVPLGCLKREQPGFIPKLPLSLQQAIAGASYCGLEKALISFPTAFWESTDFSTKDTEQAQSDVKRSFPVFSHFLHPDFAPPEQRSSTIEMMTLSSTTAFGKFAQPALQFYLWGQAAADMTSAVAGLEPSSTDYHTVITRLFQPFYSRLPNHQEGFRDCVPVAVLATRWQRDEFAGYGSYTNFQVPGGRAQSGSDPVIDEGVKVMRRGTPERGIWLAGVHTVPFVALGTTTGAYWSGEIAAVKLIEGLQARKA